MDADWRKGKKKRRRRRFCCYSSDLSCSSSSELSGSSASTCLAYPGSFWCVHIISIHFFLADEASLSLKLHLTNSLPESCWSLPPWIRTCGGGGCCWWHAVVQNQPDEGEKIGREGEGGGGKKTGCIGRKGNSVCGVKTKEKAKERKKKLKSSERGDKWVLCVH